MEAGPNAVANWVAGPNNVAPLPLLFRRTAAKLALVSTRSGAPSPFTSATASELGLVPAGKLKAEDANVPLPCPRRTAMLPGSVVVFFPVLATDPGSIAVLLGQ